MCAVLVTVSCNHERDRGNALPKPEKEVISPEISHSHITSFAEDKWGHVWIGTSHGLNKNIVTGYHQYLASPDSLTIDDNHISSLLCDSRKRLWVASLNSSVSILTDEGKFRRVAIDYHKMGRTQLLETTDGKVVLNAEKKVFAYNEQSDKMTALVDCKEKNIGCFALDNARLMIVYERWADIYTMHPFRKVKHIELGDTYKTASMRNRHEVWLATRGKIGILRIDAPSTHIDFAPKILRDYVARKQVTVCQVLQYNAQTVIVNTKEIGAIRYNIRGQSLVTPDDADYPYSIGRYNTSCIFVDSHHNLWIGSDGGGYKVVNSQQGFFHQLTDNGLFNQLQINCLACDPKGQTLWVVAFGRELYHYDFATNKAQLVWTTNEDQSQAIKAIASSSPSVLWMLTGDRVLKASYKNQVVSVDKSFTIEAPEGIVLDRGGKPWVLDRDGRVLKYSPVKDDFKQVYQYQHQPGAKTFMTILANGHILFGGMDGNLVEVNTGTMQATTVAGVKMLQKACASGHFIPEVIREDRGGKIWIGTQDDGVLVVDRRKGSITTVQGINCEEISSIEQDASGHMWIGTQYGLYECAPDGKFINGFFKPDGLSSNSFSERASVSLPGGTLVFGELQGLTAFKPTGKQNKKDIRIVFEDLKVNNRLIIPSKGQPIDKSLSERPDIVLNYHQNNFSISYAVPDYRHFSRLHYQYRLEGFEREWTDAGGNQEAFYSNIPAGNYTFSVRIEDHSKKGDFFTQSIHIRVKPAPWASWWAYLFYLLLITAVGHHYYLMHHRSAAERERIRKVEEEKAHEQRTNEINKRYFANVAHQLRTPVTMISAPIQQLVDDKEIKGKRHELLQIVNHNIGRMIRLVNQLMDFNKLETDALSLRVKLIDINPILQRTLDIYQMNAEEKGITFHTEGLDGNCFTYADADKLVNIVDNLLSNAIKFTPKGGQISLCVHHITRDEADKEFQLTAQDTDSQYVIVKVSDTGPGIPEKELTRIFERYYQVDTNRQGHFNWGTGIGLYYSLRLVELHHGHIMAVNNEGGPGAAFKFMLPSSAESYSEKERTKENTKEELQREEQPALYKQEDRSTVSDDITKPKVLVVDDDTDISYFMRTLLSEKYRVTCCYDVESAKKQLSESMPDIVISDVVMMGESGIDLCQYIKSELQFCHIPVILLTAKSNLEDQIAGIGAGADAYVTKPFNTAYLLQVIETTLINREKIKKALTSEGPLNAANTDGLSPQDQAFMKELYKIMDRELSNDEYNISAIVEEMHLSHSKFIYKVKGLTGLTPSEFFKSYKLTKAAELLRKGEYNISEVAYMTGFTTLAHFSKVFKKKFGISPSQYLNSDSTSSPKEK